MASGRSYLLDSSRVLVEGNVYGMYLFGYGNFFSAAGDVGITLTRDITANAGHQRGSPVECKWDTGPCGSESQPERSSRRHAVFILGDQDVYEFGLAL